MSIGDHPDSQKFQMQMLCHLSCVKLGLTPDHVVIIDVTPIQFVLLEVDIRSRSIVPRQVRFSHVVE